MGVTAGEGVAGCVWYSALYRMEIRIQNPGTRDPEDNFQVLHYKAGRKIRQSDPAGKFLVIAPIKKAKYGKQKGLLPKTGNELKKIVTCRSPYAFQKP